MGTRVTEYIEKCQRKRGEIGLLTKQIEAKKASLITLQDRAKAIMEAQVLIQQTAIEIQVSVVFRINEIVNKTLAAVFPTYSFELVYEIKRNKSEASLKFFSGENEIKIMEDSGGACNLATTALRLAVWSLSKSANVLILDESLSNLSVDLHARAGEVLVELCRALNLQIILVSHSAIINEKADKLVMVTKDAHDVSAV